MRVHTIKVHGPWDQPPLGSSTIREVRASWSLAKEAAGFEVHGPAIFQLMFESHPEEWRPLWNHMGSKLAMADQMDLPR